MVHGLYKMCSNTMVCYVLYSAIVLGSLRRRQHVQNAEEFAPEEVEVWVWQPGQ